MTSENKPRVTPPAWANRFLEWYCHPALLEEIQGDALELFYRTAKTDQSRARRNFAWNVIRFFRWRNIRKDRINVPTTSRDMIKSYLVSGVRNMFRNATPSLINITGLSIAIGVAVTVFVLEDSFYDLDSMHTRGDRIALVVNQVKDGDESFKTARSSFPLAELLKQNSAVEMVARAGRTGAIVRVGELVFSESVFFADAEFMKMFDFEVVRGDRIALANKNQLLISQSMAEKYYGSEEAVGKPMTLKFNDDKKLQYDFIIGGILEDTPANSSMYMDIMVPSAVWTEMNQEGLNDWSRLLSSNFILFKPGADWGAVDKDLRSFKEFQNLADQHRPIQASYLLPLKEVAPASWEISGSLSWSNAPAAMVAISVIGIFILLLASFNYMNVAVASVSTRLKEIGVRKVIGGGRREIITQFLLENAVLCSIALVTGTLLAYYLLVPGFNQLFPVKIDFSVSSWQMAVAFFGGLLVVIALLSGAYPALYVSSFNAVRILKGKETFGSKSKFSRSLLTVQFALSITTVVATLLFVHASLFFEDLDWGYGYPETIMVSLQAPDQYEEMRSQLRSQTTIKGIAGAARHVGYSSQSGNVIHEGSEYASRVFPVGAEYLEVMGIRLKHGRLFDELIASDEREGAVINERFAHKMGWNDEAAIGKEFLLDSAKRYVIGVVKDFYYSDFYSPIEPVVFTLVPTERYAYMVVQTGPDDVPYTKELIEVAWKQVAPDEPNAVRLQSSMFDSFQRSNRSNNKIMYFVAGVAVFLAAMGLYGLVSYNLTRRLREFSVRKVFGASISEIFVLMTRDYAYLVLIAFGVGAPLGAFLMESLLTSIYPTQIPTNYTPYVVSVGVMILMVGATVFSQFRRVTHENPVETLRME